MPENVEHILKWIDKSRNEEDYFDKFVYGFFALNALYSEYFVGEDMGEKGAIKELFKANYDRNQKDLAAIFDTPEYEYFCNRAPIVNMRYDPSVGKGSPDTRRDSEIIRERIPWKSSRSMLLILYQIRCNLFHGNKSFGSSNDQEVMKNASELLLRYNDIFTKRYR